MTEWADDPLEVRLSCVYQAVRLNKRASVDKVIEDARKIEDFLKAAKPKAKTLKLCKSRAKR